MSARGKPERRNLPAYPRLGQGAIQCIESGMTIREYAVFQVLAGLCSNPQVVNENDVLIYGDRQRHPSHLTDAAERIADHMLDRMGD